ncbi:MAG: hypothetical protein JNM24_07370 [Bdellovibrionaceae bacterium]|nr:hypothetical protein [Pseudobdellovibrionaceae bacterium]
MKMNFLLGAILILCFSGCIVVPKKTEDKFIVAPVFVDKKCSSTSAKIIYKQVLKSDFTSERYVDPNENHGGIRVPSKYILDTIQKYGFLETNSKNGNFDIFIEFTVHEDDYSNFLQQSNFWLTNLTLGIIPSWGSGNIRITSMFRDKDGTVVGEYASQKVEYNFFKGIIFFPFNFDSKNTPAYMHSEYIPKMTIDIFNQAAAKNILCGPR